MIKVPFGRELLEKIKWEIKFFGFDFPFFIAYFPYSSGHCKLTHIFPGSRYFCEHCDCGQDYFIVYPPSVTSVVPVVKDAASDAR